MRIRDPRDLGLWWVAAAMFAYISVRAFLVPVVHDEARVMRLYVYSGHLLPPLAKLDAGNHLLVTLLGQWTTFLFGYKLWAVRLFPVLTYPLYAFGVIGLMRMIDARIIRRCFGIALLTMPYLFEFFSLFRGYGPSIAFEVLGLLSLIRYMVKGDTRSFALLLACHLFQPLPDVGVLRSIRSCNHSTCHLSGTRSGQAIRPVAFGWCCRGIDGVVWDVAL